MVTVPETHDVALLAPWYVTAPQNVAIHRYLDSGFVAQFQADVSSAPQNNANLFKWQSDDKVSTTDTRLKLRRPVHRTFHMVAWEASCKMATAPAGYPAIPPAKIASAGFVLRDVSGASPLGFTSRRASPRVGRRSRARRRIPTLPGASSPCPWCRGRLRPARATRAKRRFHCTRFRSRPRAGRTRSSIGYLPIGGGDYVPQTSTAPDSGVTNELPWPFGLRITPTARRRFTPLINRSDRA